MGHNAAAYITILLKLLVGITGTRDTEFLALLFANFGWVPQGTVRNIERLWDEACSIVTVFIRGENAESPLRQQILLIYLKTVSVGQASRMHGSPVYNQQNEPLSSQQQFFKRKRNF